MICVTGQWLNEAQKWLHLFHCICCLDDSIHSLNLWKAVMGDVKWKDIPTELHLLPRVGLSKYCIRIFVHWLHVLLLISMENTQKAFWILNTDFCVGWLSPRSERWHGYNMEPALFYLCQKSMLAKYNFLLIWLFSVFWKQSQPANNTTATNTYKTTAILLHGEMLINT